MMTLLYSMFVLSGLFYGFINFNPQFGSNPSKKEQIKYDTFQNYEDGKFKNLEKTQRTTGKFSIIDFFKMIQTGCQMIY